MALGGRVKDAILALFRASVPHVDYATGYRAKVTKQSADLLSVDVEPDDTRLPRMSGIPIRHTVPGLKVQVPTGTFVMVWWENMDPSKPYAALWDNGATTKVVLVATTVEVGAENLNPVIDGVVRADCPDPFTGSTHGALGGASTAVMVRKV